MIGTSTTQRERVTVAGAQDALDAFIANRSTMPAGVAAARAIVAVNIDWPAARDRIVGSDHSIILAEQPGGPVLAAKHLPAGSVTVIHDHGHAGAALVVEGSGRYERFERVDNATGRLESVHDLALGDVVWWNDPPDDLHRQTGLGDGSIEVILLAGAPTDPAEYADATAVESEFRQSITRGFLDGDIALLEPWYDANVLADVNVPQWRFQQRGRSELMDLVRAEEFAKPDRRLSHLRVTDTAEGLLVETEMRYTEKGDLRLFREVHQLRVRDELVVEHVLWCSGISDTTTAHAQFATAPMERL